MSWSSDGDEPSAASVGRPGRSGRPVRIDVDDEHWGVVRVAAVDVGLTVGRYVGELVEAAAYEVGWRAGASPGSQW